eukprot:m.1441560 g.1441560  ORF g.1441560 m.1441560 type:complete len:84 (+) comp25094_c0_seq59:551-802(+)
MSPCLHSIIRKFFVNAFIRCCMQTPDIDVFGNYTCPLPPPMTEGPIIVGGIGDSGTRGIMCMFVFVNRAFRRNSIGGNDFSLE